MILTVALSITLGLAASLKEDNVVGRSNSECFKKISAGERLIGYYVTRIVERDTVDGCEQECNIYKCTHFSFSVALEGKKICELSTDRQISRRQDPNFDLYEKTNECVQGKPTGYEEACYRRIISGKRLHERFIRHSLPCNSLESCQHQCSIEKHFDCQGFNIRLDPQRVGRGVCELSSFSFTHLDVSRDFIYDPEFVYYERDRDNNSPNCGFFIQNPNALQPNIRNDGIGHRNSIAGGPYYGGDSYGPWSTGFGTADHGPWGSYGYGSGFYQSNNPSRGPTPPFQPNPVFSFENYGYGRKPFIDNQNQNYGGSNPSMLQWDRFPFYKNYPNHQGNTYPNMQKTPTYIIIDADAKRVDYDAPKNNLKPNRVALPYYPPRYQGFIFNIPNYPPQQEEIQGPKNYQSGPFFYNSRPNSVSREGNFVRHFSVSPNDPQNSLIVPQNPFLKPQDVRPGFTYYSANPTTLPRLPMFPSPPFSSSSPQFFIDKFPHTYLPSSNANFNSISRKPANHEVCFQRAHPGYKLNSLSIKGMYDTPTVLDCETMCTSSSSFKCTGYSFRYSTANKDPNCLLTDFTSLTRETHLLPDRSCDVYFKMTTCLDINRMSDTECFIKMASDKAIDSSKIVKSVWVRGLSDCELACLNSNIFTCRSFTFRYSPSIIGQSTENCFLSDWPIVELSHLNFMPLTGHDVYERGSYGHGCELNPGPPYIGPEFANQFPITTQLNPNKEMWNIEETWKHFTVNGWPCKIGSQCQLNPQLGFWSCEIAGGDKAQWDYCCRPQHSCGYSRGYNYPWCYVGEASQDQWRPCSEYYYPDFDNRYPDKPVQLLPDFPLGPPRDERPPVVGDVFGPPTLWPVSYFYAEPPPNATYWDESSGNLHHHHHHYHYHYHPDEVLEHLQSPPEQDDNRSIKFKSCSPKFPYPRAIIQKLDFKKVPEPEDARDQLTEEEKVENSRTPKKVNSEYAAEEILLTSKKNFKEEQKELSAYTSLPVNDTEKIEETTESINNMKEAISAMETTIRENSNDENLKTVKKNDTNGQISVTFN